MTGARVAIGQLPANSRESALDPHGSARQDAAVAELTGLLRESAGGDRLAGWPADMRILVRREKIDEGTQLSLLTQQPQDGANHHRAGGTRRHRTTRASPPCPEPRNQHHRASSAHVARALAPG